MYLTEITGFYVSLARAQLARTVLIGYAVVNIAVYATIGASSSYWGDDLLDVVVDNPTIECVFAGRKHCHCSNMPCMSYYRHEI